MGRAILVQSQGRRNKQQPTAHLIENSLGLPQALKKSRLSVPLNIYPIHSLITFQIGTSSLLNIAYETDLPYFSALFSCGYRRDPSFGDLER